MTDEKCYVEGCGKNASSGWIKFVFYGEIQQAVFCDTHYRVLFPKSDMNYTSLSSGHASVLSEG